MRQHQAITSNTGEAEEEVSDEYDEDDYKGHEPRREVSENVKNAVALPKLESVRAADPSLRCGEWIIRTRLAIRGFSPTAGTWFTHVLETAQEAYRRWTVAQAL